MKHIVSKIFLAVAVTGLWSINFAPEFPHLPTLAGNAEAVVGRPLSPVSVAGVARRSTRRHVAVASTSAAQPQAAAPAPAPAGLPTGTIVSALPAGCTSQVVDGVSLFNCAGVFYQPTFQSNNLVYQVK